MSAVKISISMDEADIAYLDDEARAGRYASRSAVIHEAVRLLRESRLADAYAAAFAEWHDDEWDVASADGITAA